MTQMKMALICTSLVLLLSAYGSDAYLLRSITSKSSADSFNYHTLVRDCCDQLTTSGSQSCDEAEGVTHCLVQARQHLDTNIRRAGISLIEATSSTELQQKSGDVMPDLEFLKHQCCERMKSMSPLGGGCDNAQTMNACTASASAAQAFRFTANLAKENVAPSTSTTLLSVNLAKEQATTLSTTQGPIVQADVPGVSELQRRINKCCVNLKSMVSLGSCDQPQALAACTSSAEASLKPTLIEPVMVTSVTTMPPGVPATRIVTSDITALTKTEATPLGPLQRRIKDCCSSLKASGSLDDCDSHPEALAACTSSAEASLKPIEPVVVAATTTAPPSVPDTPIVTPIITALAKTSLSALQQRINDCCTSLKAAGNLGDCDSQPEALAACTSSAEASLRPVQPVVASPVTTTLPNVPATPIVMPEVTALAKTEVKSLGALQQRINDCCASLKTAGNLGDCESDSEALAACTSSAEASLRPVLPVVAAETTTAVPLPVTMPEVAVPLKVDDHTAGTTVDDPIQRRIKSCCDQLAANPTLGMTCEEPEALNSCTESVHAAMAPRPAVPVEVAAPTQLPEVLPSTSQLSILLTKDESQVPAGPVDPLQELIDNCCSKLKSMPSLGENCDQPEGLNACRASAQNSFNMRFSVGDVAPPPQIATVDAPQPEVAALVKEDSATSSLAPVMPVVETDVQRRIRECCENLKTIPGLDNCDSPEALKSCTDSANDSLLPRPVVTAMVEEAASTTSSFAPSSSAPIIPVVEDPLQRLIKKCCDDLHSTPGLGSCDQQEALDSCTESAKASLNPRPVVAALVEEVSTTTSSLAPTLSAPIIPVVQDALQRLIKKCCDDLRSIPGLGSCDQQEALNSCTQSAKASMNPRPVVAALVKEVPTTTSSLAPSSLAKITPVVQDPLQRLIKKCCDDLRSIPGLGSCDQQEALNSCTESAKASLNPRPVVATLIKEASTTTSSLAPVIPVVEKRLQRLIHQCCENLQSIPGLGNCDQPEELNACTESAKASLNPQKQPPVVATLIKETSTTTSSLALVIPVVENHLQRLIHQCCENLQSIPGLGNCDQPEALNACTESAKDALNPRPVVATLVKEFSTVTTSLAPSSSAAASVIPVVEDPLHRLIKQCCENLKRIPGLGDCSEPEVLNSCTVSATASSKPRPAENAVQVDSSLAPSQTTQVPWYAAMVKEVAVTTTSRDLVDSDPVQALIAQCCDKLKSISSLGQTCEDQAALTACTSSVQAAMEHRLGDAMSTTVEAISTTPAAMAQVMLMDSEMAMNNEMATTSRAVYSVSQQLVNQCCDRMKSAVGLNANCDDPQVMAACTASVHAQMEHRLGSDVLASSIQTTTTPPVAKLPEAVILAKRDMSSGSSDPLQYLINQCCDKLSSIATLGASCDTPEGLNACTASAHASLEHRLGQDLALQAPAQAMAPADQVATQLPDPVVLVKHDVIMQNPSDPAQQLINQCCTQLSSLKDIGGSCDSPQGLSACTASAHASLEHRLVANVQVTNMPVHDDVTTSAPMVAVARKQERSDIEDPKIKACCQQLEKLANIGGSCSSPQGLAACTDSVQDAMNHRLGENVKLLPMNQPVQPASPAFVNTQAPQQISSSAVVAQLASESSDPLQQLIDKCCKQLEPLAYMGGSCASEEGLQTCTNSARASFNHQALPTVQLVLPPVQKVPINVSPIDDHTPGVVALGAQDLYNAAGLATLDPFQKMVGECCNRLNSLGIASCDRPQDLETCKTSARNFMRLNDVPATSTSAPLASEAEEYFAEVFLKTSKVASVPAQTPDSQGLSHAPPQNHFQLLVDSCCSQMSCSQQEDLRVCVNAAQATMVSRPEATEVDLAQIRGVPAGSSDVPKNLLPVMKQSADRSGVVHLLSQLSGASSKLQVLVNDCCESRKLTEKNCDIAEGLRECVLEARVADIPRTDANLAKEQLQVASDLRSDTSAYVENMINQCCDRLKALGIGASCENEEDRQTCEESAHTEAHRRPGTVNAFNTHYLVTMEPSPMTMAASTTETTTPFVVALVKEVPEPEQQSSSFGFSWPLKPFPSLNPWKREETHTVKAVAPIQTKYDFQWFINDCCNKLSKSGYLSCDQTEVMDKCIVHARTLEGAFKQRPWEFTLNSVHVPVVRAPRLRASIIEKTSTVQPAVQQDLASLADAIKMIPAPLKTHSELDAILKLARVCCDKKEKAGSESCSKPEVFDECLDSARKLMYEPAGRPWAEMAMMNQPMQPQVIISTTQSPLALLEKSLAATTTSPLKPAEADIVVTLTKKCCDKRTAETPGLGCDVPAVFHECLTESHSEMGIDERRIEKQIEEAAVKKAESLQNVPYLHHGIQPALIAKTISEASVSSQTDMSSLLHALSLKAAGGFKSRLDDIMTMSRRCCDRREAERGENCAKPEVFHRCVVLSRDLSGSSSMSWEDLAQTPSKEVTTNQAVPSLISKTQGAAKDDPDEHSLGYACCKEAQHSAVGMTCDQPQVLRTCFKLAHAQMNSFREPTVSLHRKSSKEASASSSNDTSSLSVASADVENFFGWDCCRKQQSLKNGITCDKPEVLTSCFDFARTKAEKISKRIARDSSNTKKNDVVAV